MVYHNIAYSNGYCQEYLPYDVMTAVGIAPGFANTSPHTGLCLRCEAMRSTWRGWVLTMFGFFWKYPLVN